MSNCDIHTILMRFFFKGTNNDNDTNNGNQKGLPTFGIMSKIVTDDIIPSQTANSRYQ